MSVLSQDDLRDGLTVAGVYRFSGHYELTEPIVISASVTIDCTDATFDASALARWGSAPEAMFRIVGGITVEVFGGKFRNGNLLTVECDLQRLSVDVDAFEDETDGHTIYLIPPSPVSVHVATASIRTRKAINCSLIFSTTFGGSKLITQFDRVEGLIGYAVRTRPEIPWDSITLTDSVFDGNSKEEIAAVRVMQSLVKSNGTVTLINVTMENMVCDGYASLLYWSQGNAVVSGCVVRNITSRTDERFIESKSTDDGCLHVAHTTFDQRQVDAAETLSPCIDAKERRFIIDSSTFLGCTGPCVMSQVLAGYTAYSGDRKFIRNTVEGHRSPAIVAVQVSSDHQTMSAVVVEDNVVTEHDNPEHVNWQSAPTTALVNVLCANGSSRLAALMVRRNHYSSSYTGRCCLVRLNQYAADIRPVDFSRGDMVEMVVMADNVCRLPSGWLLTWRNGDPLGLIVDSGNELSGSAGLFGDDLQRMRSRAPKNYMSQGLRVTP